MNAGCGATHAPTSLDGRRLSYDALGRLTGDGERVYEWNTVDQLAAVRSAQGASTENGFDSEGVRRYRKETTASGKTRTTLFVSDWEEVVDGKLVRYIVHTERRLVRLAETNGVVSSAGIGAVAVPRSGPASAALGLLAGLVVVLLSGARRALGLRLQGVTRALCPAVAVVALFVCSSDVPSGRSAPSATGSVQALSEADTILVHDQLGSVLAEVSGSGAPRGRFATYAYGLERYATAGESRLYAGHVRDRGVGLDLMGARFYAPDLGVWTAADPGLLNSPQRGTGSEFGAVNAYAYSNLNPVGARDPNGEFWHVLAGAVLGGAVGGGVEAARQYLAQGKVEDWGRVRAAAVGGAIAGTVMATVPTAGYAAVMALGATTGAAGGVAQRLHDSGGKSAGTVTDVVIDSAIGAATAGIVKGASAVIGKAVRSAAPKAARPLGNVRALDSESTFRKQYALLGKGEGGAAGGAQRLTARFDLSRAGHIFREAAGHVNPASAGSQARFARLFENVASKPANLRADAVQAGLITQQAAEAGVQAFTWSGRAGQVWVTIRNGVVQNAGVNPLGAFR